MRQAAQTETYMTSVERMSHYAFKLEPERDTDTNKRASSFSRAVAAVNFLVAERSSRRSRVGARSSTSWPSRGQIQLSRLRVRYRSDMPLVIKGISATINAGSKVGVVGRTGR